MSSRMAAVLAILLVCERSAAQTTPAASTPEREDKHSGAPLGQFTAGPFIVTPTFRIGTLAVDTNVQYSRERRADFVASAGPGLDIALPFRDHWQLAVQGTSQYFYFQRTEELRRWTGGGSSSLDWATTGTRATLSAGLNREFARPSFEVDTRIATTRLDVRGNLERDLGRLTLAMRSSFLRTEIDEGEEFRGADLAIALTTDQFVVSPELRYRLTPLTALLFETEYQQTRFPNAPIRDFEQGRVGAGFLLTGLLKGQVTAGVRRTQLLNGSDKRDQPYLRGNLTQKLGRRFTLREGYNQESSVSAFAVDGRLPTYENKAVTLDLGIQLASRIDLRLNGRRESLKSDGLVQVILDDGTLSSARRDDVAYVAGADLGIRLGRARLASFVTYTTRKSEFFRDFGIDGLLAGARVEYSPR